MVKKKTEARLLTEEEVHEFKTRGFVIAGQCHAAEGFWKDSVMWFCPNRRSAFRRTCDEHRGIR